MDLVSLGIGGVSLLFQAFAGCVAGYELLSAAKGMPEDYGYLRCRLKMEQFRLLDWGTVVDIDAPVREDEIADVHDNLVYQILNQQEMLLKKFGRLDEQYRPLRTPMISEEVEKSIPLPIPMRPPTTEPDEVLKPPPAYASRASTTIEQPTRASTFGKRFPDEHLLTKSLRVVEEFKKYPRKLKWAAFDQKKLEGLLTKLTSNNDFLMKRLDRKQQQALERKQARTELQITALHSKVEDLIQIYQALTFNVTSNVQVHVPFSLAWDSAPSIDAKVGNEAHGARLATFAQMKGLHSAIERKQLDETVMKALNLDTSDPTLLHLEMDKKRHVMIADGEQVDTDPDIESRTEACVYPWHNSPHRDMKHVWIEWKEYRPIDMDGNPDPKVVQRIQDMAQMLRHNSNTNMFRAPHCLGYFQDVDEEGEPTYRFGLAFEKPPQVHKDTRPTSLLEMMTDEVGEIPSLTDRASIASSLATILERFHAINWLHKGLRSHNILFFEEAGELNYAKPYVSGFDYSRLADKEDLTERPPENPRYDVYRHPKVHGGGPRDGAFKKMYDIYSFGIILLEIAHWKSIDKILGIEDIDKAKPSITYRIRGKLLDQSNGYLKALRRCFGNVYADVVEKCLIGAKAFGIPEDADDSEAVVAEKLTKAFYEGVVGELGRIVV